MVSQLLANADQDAGREGNLELPGCFQCRQATSGNLVWCKSVGLEIRSERLDHHPLARTDSAKGQQVVFADSSGIGVGEQSGLV